jgi:hypothetical protein
VPVPYAVLLPPVIALRGGAGMAPESTARPGGAFGPRPDAPARPAGASRFARVSPPSPVRRMLPDPRNVLP